MEWFPRGKSPKTSRAQRTWVEQGTRGTPKEEKKRMMETQRGALQRGRMMQNEKCIKKIPCPQSVWSSGPSPLPKQGNSWPVRGAGCPAHALPWEPGSAHAAGTASCYQHPTQEPRACPAIIVSDVIYNGGGGVNRASREIYSSPECTFTRTIAAKARQPRNPPYPGAGGGHGFWQPRRADSLQLNFSGASLVPGAEAKESKVAADRSARPEPPLLGQERQGEELLFQHLHSLRFFLQLPAGPGLQAVTLQSKCQMESKTWACHPQPRSYKKGRAPRPCLQ